MIKPPQPYPMQVPGNHLHPGLEDQDSSLKSEFPLAHVATVAALAPVRAPVRGAPHGVRSSLSQALGDSTALRVADEWDPLAKLAQFKELQAPLWGMCFSKASRHGDQHEGPSNVSKNKTPQASLHMKSRRHFDDNSMAGAVCGCEGAKGAS